MAITDKEQGVWELDEVYNKINEGGIWTYSAGFEGFYVSGYNQQGNLGQNQGPAQRTAVSSPVQIPGTAWENFNFMTVCGDRSGPVGGVKSDNTMWLWGSDGDGELGQNTRNVHQSSPTQLPGSWNSITYGHQAMAAAKTDGTMWTWGNNFSGQLGANFGPSNPYNRSSPIQVGTDTTWGGGYTGTFNNGQSNKVNGGAYFFSAVKTDGTWWAWGNGNAGQLGQNEQLPYNQGRSSPVQIGTDTDWSTLATGLRYDNVCIKTDGTAWGCGANGEGQMMRNDKTYRSSPTQIPGTWKSFSGGGDSAGGVKTDGTAWTCGRNNYGQLGVNDRTNISSPKQIPGTWDYIQISDMNCVGLKSDNTLWAWGRNQYGGLSQNNIVALSSPTQIPGFYFSTALSTRSKIFATKGS